MTDWLNWLAAQRPASIDVASDGSAMKIHLGGANADFGADSIAQNGAIISSFYITVVAQDDGVFSWHGATGDHVPHTQERHHAIPLAEAIATARAWALAHNVCWTEWPPNWM